jgi:Uma2 family endonuclease
MEDIPHRRLLRLTEWEKIVEARVFPEFEQLELIRGEMISLAPVSDPNVPSILHRHAGCVRRLNYHFSSHLRSQVLVDIQSLIKLRKQKSEPRPDLSLLRFREDFYGSCIPKPKDICLLIEVADSSLAYDRDTKMPLYAEAGIPESWLVDLNSSTLFVYRRPSPERYQDVRAYRRGESVAPEAFPEVTFTVDEILG